MENEFQVFISYTRADQSIAEGLFDLLENNDLNPWLDKKKIKGGQNWDFELRRALEKSSVILLLWSASSKDHRGYIQREIKLALKKFEEKLVDDIFILPVIIGNDAKIPEQLRDIHCLSWEDSGIENQILESTRHQLERLGGKSEKTQETEQVFWKPVEIKEEWDGLPGYRIDISSFEFSSTKYKNISNINNYVNAQFLENLFFYRREKFSQEPEHFNYSQDEWSRTYTFDAFCGKPTIVGSTLSLLLTKSWYSPGAAHPVQAHESFNFLLEPCTYFSKLSEIFEDPETAFPKLQSIVREKLLQHEAVRFGDPETPPDQSAIDWVNEGTQDWDQLQSFVLTENGTEIFFNSYQVACFAAGLPHVVVGYVDIRDDLKKYIQTALRIQYRDFSK